MTSEVPSNTSPRIRQWHEDSLAGRPDSSDCLEQRTLPVQDRAAAIRFLGPDAPSWVGASLTSFAALLDRVTMMPLRADTVSEHLVTQAQSAFRNRSLFIRSRHPLEF